MKTDVRILLLCPDESNAALVRDTGMLAYALLKQNIAVGILTNAEEKSQFDALSAVLPLFYTEPTFFGNDFAKSLQNILNNHQKIEIVHLMNCSEVAHDIAKVCAKHNIPMLGNIHHETHLSGEKLWFMARRKHQQSLHEYHPIIVPTLSLLDKARTANLREISYVPEGVDTDRFKPVMSKRPVRRALGLPEKTTIICCMADISASNKQIETLDICMPLGDHLHLLFMGNIKSKTYHSKLEQHINELDVGNYVHIIEPSDKPEEYLKASDIFVLLGGIEGRRLSILEAQSCGLPVVLAPSDSSLALTQGNKSGVVVYDDNALTKQAVEKMITDPVYRQSRSLQARPFVVKEHNYKDTVKKHIKLYASLK